MPIPPERRYRNPLITEESFARLEALLQHPDAPPWNVWIGDRIQAEDLAAVERFRAEVRAWEEPSPAHGALQGAPHSAPPRWLVERLCALRPVVPAFAARLPDTSPAALAAIWPALPTTSRADLVLHLDEFVPLDQPLEDLITYETSGTTGHALPFPSHPRATGQTHALLERALAAHGVTLQTGPAHTACVHLCAQADTWEFANVLSVWGGAGFAKVNLNASRWSRDAAARYLRDLAPQVVAVNPLSLAEWLRWEIPHRPKAFVSTSLPLPPAMRAEVHARTGAAVIDWYSTTETGPIAWSAPDGEGMCMAAPDLFVEILDAWGRPVPEGELGEVAVSGGRNPYLPLLRYRTGDRARMGGVDTPTGRALRLWDLQGRAHVPLVGAGGVPVNTIDISRTLRARALFVQHQLHQSADGAVRLRLRPFPGVPLDLADLQAAIAALFGPGVSVRVEEDASLPDKLLPFTRDLP